MKISNRRQTRPLILVFGFLLIALPCCSVLLPAGSWLGVEAVYNLLSPVMKAAIGGSMAIVLAVCTLLAIRMRVASVSMICMILLVTGVVISTVSSTVAYSAARRASADGGMVTPSRLLIDGGAEGIRVTCNGVDLGVTPISMSLDEFKQRVSPADGPPDQPNVKIESYAVTGFQYLQAGWTHVPSRFPGESLFSFHEHTVPEKSVMKRFEKAEYWWSFRSGEAVGRMAQLQWSQVGEVFQLNGRVRWPEEKRHASLLALLADSEGVDPRTAYADHIRDSSAILSVLLDQKYEPVEQQRRATAGLTPKLDHEMSQPLSFNEAVYRDDLGAIVRSGDPRSAAVIRSYLNDLYSQYHSHQSVMTFGRRDLQVMAQSSVAEVTGMVQEVLSHADWTHAELVENFVSVQIAKDVDRGSLQSWLVGLDFGPGHTGRAITRMLVRLGADKFSEVADHIDHQELLEEIRRIPSADLRPSVVQWLVSQWKVAPESRILKTMVVHAELEAVRQAWKQTSLENSRAVADLTLTMRSVGDSVDKAVFADFFVEVIAREMNQSGLESDDLNQQFAKQLESLGTAEAIKVLRNAAEQHQKKNSIFRKVLGQVEGRIAWAKTRRQEDIQLAHELIADEVSLVDLIETTSFVWQDGRYEVVSESDTDSGQ
ncbi:MAG: hypothetical protein ABJZ55_10005 [Fuerstiella sp.]